MRNRRLLYALILSVSSLGANAQLELVAASGASFHNSSGSLTYSIGEVVISTLTTSEAILTQGFLQTWVQSNVPVIQEPEIQMSVYPNPVTDQLILQIGAFQGFRYTLYNILGEMIGQGQVVGERTEIDFTGMAPAVYILRVADNREQIRLFQIVKH